MGYVRSDQNVYFTVVMRLRGAPYTPQAST